MGYLSSLGVLGVLVPLLARLLALRAAGWFLGGLDACRGAVRCLPGPGVLGVFARLLARLAALRAAAWFLGGPRTIRAEVRFLRARPAGAAGFPSVSLVGVPGGFPAGRNGCSPGPGSGVPAWAGCRRRADSDGPAGVVGRMDGRPKAVEGYAAPRSTPLREIGQNNTDLTPVTDVAAVEHNP
ncbi:hypothetical protein Aph01nite_58720 [Acrocarpospora phusangensis]|uniref:Uncharacterized protein n=1 Tax=Acrocarpospora phusangensis TaxID=1070424 RepID=A0A919QEP7_9ACTN|nr:hypothetical protein Aph01nite_58720 [Acrocarpospora phusangensis]